MNTREPEKQQTEAANQLAKNIEANETFIKKEYPGVKFISDEAEFRSKNKYTKGLTLLKNVKVAESRIPRNPRQREVLRKELRQAGMLARRGDSVYLIPETGGYKVRPKDAIVNGRLFEFRAITGNARSVEWEFSDAKRKGNDTNVFISIDSDISKKEARRRVAQVIGRHPEYTGEVVLSFGEKLYSWDSSDFR